MAEELRESGVVTAMSVVGFVFGVIGMVGSFIPCLGSLAFFIGIPAAVISGIAVGIACSQNAKRTFAIVATTISLIGVVVSGIQYYTVISAGKKAERMINEMNRRNLPPAGVDGIGKTKARFSRDILMSRSWRFGRGDGSVIARRIRFLPDGRIEGYYHPNEARWGMTGNDVVFFHENGKVTTRFTVFVRNSKNRWMIRGPHLLANGAIHTLTEVPG